MYQFCKKVLIYCCKEAVIFVVFLLKYFGLQIDGILLKISNLNLLLFSDQCLNALNQRSITVTGEMLISKKSINLQFHIPNSVCLFRAKTFWSKEPETLLWLEKNSGGVLWDIGANVGIYSVYFAKFCEGRTIAFEPLPANIKVLSQNISINKLSDKITIVPLPLAPEVGTFSFSGSVTDGNAFNQLSSDTLNESGSTVNQVSWMSVGVSLDWCSEIGVLAPPTILKIDVDGIEPLILRGGEKLLTIGSLRSILIEVEYGSVDSEEIARMLSAAGFELSGRFQSELMESDSFTEGYFNEVWNKI